VVLAKNHEMSIRELFENGVIICWSQTIYSEISLLTQHDFGFIDMQKKNQLSIFRSQHRKSSWRLTKFKPSL